MTAINTSVTRRAALTTVLLSALAAINASAAKPVHKPKFTWWAILIMMIGIVVVISVPLVVYFCCFRKEELDEKAVDGVSDVHSEGSAAVPASNHEEHEPAQKKDYPVE